MSDLDILQRRDLMNQLHRVTSELDTDGLRFVLCVAMLRRMTPKEAALVHEAVLQILSERPSDPSQENPKK